MPGETIIRWGAFDFVNENSPAIPVTDTNINASGNNFFFIIHILISCFHLFRPKQSNEPNSLKSS